MKIWLFVALSLGVILLVSIIGVPYVCPGSGGGVLCDQDSLALAIIVLGVQILVGSSVLFLLGRSAPATALRRATPAAPSDESKRAALMATDAAAPGFQNFMVMSGLRKSMPWPADNRMSPPIGPRCIRDVRPTGSIT